MKTIISIFTLLLAFQSTAQNLVPNPSFEATNGSFCEIMHASDFNATSQNWTTPTMGSPDLYSTTIPSSCFYHQPNSTYNGPIGIKGSQLPRTGDVMSAIFVFTIQGLEQREYLQVQLSTALTPGYNYIVECYVSLADSQEFATNQLGMYLSEQAINSNSNNALNYTPQVTANDYITDTQKWVRIADTIVATGAYTYLTIGNFSSDNQTPTIPNPTSSGQAGTYGAYYFIDDVRVERLRELDTDEYEFGDYNTKHKKVIKVVDFMGREVEFKPNTPVILIYSDGSRKRVIKSEQ